MSAPQANLAQQAHALLQRSQKGMDSVDLAEALGASQAQVEEALRPLLDAHELVNCGVLRPVKGEMTRMLHYRISTVGGLTPTWRSQAVATHDNHRAGIAASIAPAAPPAHESGEQNTPPQQAPRVSGRHAAAQANRARLREFLATVAEPWQETAAIRTAVEIGKGQDYFLLTGLVAAGEVKRSDGAGRVRWALATRADEKPAPDAAAQDETPEGTLYRQQREALINLLAKSPTLWVETTVAQSALGMSANLAHKKLNALQAEGVAVKRRAGQIAEWALKARLDLVELGVGTQQPLLPGDVPPLVVIPPIPPGIEFDCALRDSGVLEVQSHGQRLCLPADHTRRLFRYFDRLRAAESAEATLGEPA